MVLKARLMGVHVVREGTFEYTLSKFCYSIEHLMEKKCNMGLSSYWHVVTIINLKLKKSRLINETNYKKLILASAHLILENMPMSKEFESKRKKAIKCFESIIKKEFNLTLNNLKYYHKYIFKVEPRLINNLKNHSYFRY